MTDPTATVEHQVLEVAPAQALAALFDDGIDVPRAGELLPPLWHWVALATWSRAGSTGIDGHPRLGGFVPDVGKPRRMFAGGMVEFHRPMRLGETVRREDRVLSVTPKSGRQGHFVLVETECRIIAADGTLGIRETQQLVYRDAAGSTPSEEPITTAAEVVPQLLTEDGSGWMFRTDPTKLQRFSSATANGHRIHYDAPYAMTVEGYPGLVVHGPLMTLALIQAHRRRHPRPLRAVRHRNVAPLFCGEDARIAITHTADEFDLRLIGPRGENVRAVAQNAG